MFSNFFVSYSFYSHRTKINRCSITKHKYKHTDIFERPLSSLMSATQFVNIVLVVGLKFDILHKVILFINTPKVIVLNLAGHLAKAG